MTIQFSPQDKTEAAAKCIRTMYETAGCTAKEIKQLFHPDIIDFVIGLCDKERK